MKSIKKYFKSMSRQKWLMISVLSFSFLVAAGSAIASMTFNANTITSDGALNLNPTGQPVNVNGDYDVTGHSAFGNEGDIDVPNSFLFGDGTSVLNVSETYTDTAGAGKHYHYGISDSVIVDPSGPLESLGVYIGQSLGVLNNSTVDVGLEYGQVVGAYHNSSAHLDSLYATQHDVETFGGGTVSAMYGTDELMFIDSGVTSAYGVHIDINADSPATNVYGFYSKDLAGTATNPYYSWYDSRGVGRCKEDNTFNSVGQSICVVYNPQFTKYTAGAADYERIVYGQWNSNVAEIGVEKGGTGTLRDLRLIGANIDLNASVKIAGDMVYVTTTPTITSGFGGAGKAVGSGSKASSFKITVGAGGGSSGVAAFNGTFTNAPSCFANDETTANAMQAVSTTTQVTINGTMVASDVIKVVCIGY